MGPDEAEARASHRAPDIPECIALYHMGLCSVLHYTIWGQMKPRPELVIERLTSPSVLHYTIWGCVVYCIIPYGARQRVMRGCRLNCLCSTFGASSASSSGTSMVLIQRIALIGLINCKTRVYSLVLMRTHCVVCGQG